MARIATLRPQRRQHESFSFLFLPVTQPTPGRKLASAGINCTGYSSASLALIEISQIRWRLVLLGGHEIAVGAQEVVLGADADVIVTLGTIVLVPFAVIFFLAESFGDDPRPGERIVDGRHVVAKQRLVVLVAVEALLDDRFVVLVQRHAALVHGTRPLEVASLDFENVVAAVAVLIDPFADRIARQSRFDVGWPRPAVGIDPSGHRSFEQDECDLRHDDKFEWENSGHHARHAGGQAGETEIVARPPAAWPVMLASNNF